MPNKNLDLKNCPFCGKPSVYIGVCDYEGTCRGEIGCKYESNPYSGLSYALIHKGWGECILCTTYVPMGGVLFDTPEEAAETWNEGVTTK